MPKRWTCLNLRMNRVYWRDCFHSSPRTQNPTSVERSAALEGPSLYRGALVGSSMVERCAEGQLRRAFSRILLGLNRRAPDTNTAGLYSAAAVRAHPGARRSTVAPSQERQGLARNDHGSIQPPSLPSADGDIDGGVLLYDPPASRRGGPRPRERWR